jgi:uncharacterized protein (TIGR01244 family)
MDIKRLNAKIAVSPQIKAEDMVAIARAGYRSVICNRPEGEEQSQPATATIEAAAKSAGLRFVHIPAISGALTEQNGRDMAQAIHLSSSQNSSKWQSLAESKLKNW